MKPCKGAVLAACLALLALPGCGGGGDGVAVTGTVSYKGEPLPDGSISFIPVEGTTGPTAGATIADGRFSIGRQGGPMPGKFRVEISSFREDKTPKSQAGAQMFGRSAADFPAGADKQLVVKKNIIPAKYNDTSELRTTIPEASSHEVSFTLD